MSDRQPTTTHYLDRDVADLLRRVSRLEARVAELEKPKRTAVVWQDWLPPVFPIVTTLGWTGGGGSGPLTADDHDPRSGPLAAALRLPTVPDAYGR